MTQRLPCRGCWKALAVALDFAMPAWALRAWGGYPICHNDEKNWIGIARQLDAGVHWPVFGPAFIHTVRGLSRQWQVSHAQAMSLLGVACVFLSMLSLLWGYRKFAPASAAAVLAGLCLSSYFWAPLME